MTNFQLGSILGKFFLLTLIDYLRMVGAHDFLQTILSYVRQRFFCCAWYQSDKFAELYDSPWSYITTNLIVRCLLSFFNRYHVVITKLLAGF